MNAKEQIIIDIIILLGGFGKRLGSISNGLPKSLMPIGEKVFLDILLRKIFSFGGMNIYFSLHYKPEYFYSFLKKSKLSKKIETIVEPKPMGTGGAIKYVLKNKNISDPFFVINGDTISNVDLGKMKTVFLNKKNIKALIGVSNVKNAERYGTISLQSYKITKFNEKGSVGPGWINNGYYIFTKSVFDEYNGAFSLENEVFPQLATRRLLGAFKVKDDNFIDMGVPEDYKKLNNDYMALKNEL